MVSSLLKCRRCGAKNKADLATNPRVRCGRCKTEFEFHKPLGSIQTLEDASFHSAIKNSSLPVLLDCWAPWCGPCQTMNPLLKELAYELSGKCTIAKLNVDQNPATASQLKVQGIPALFLFDGEKRLHQWVGLQKKAQLLSDIASVLD